MKNYFVFIQQTEWTYKNNKPHLKYILANSLELDSIQGDGHFSEPLFMGNVESKAQGAM